MISTTLFERLTLAIGRVFKVRFTVTKLFNKLVSLSDDIKRTPSEICLEHILFQRLYFFAGAQSLINCL